MKRVFPWLGLLPLLLLVVPDVLAQGALPALEVVSGPEGEQTYSVKLQVLLLMTVLTLLPAALIMMTSFTRIVVVLAILRQALGTAQTPSSQILVGLAVFLTLFIMAPVFERIYTEAYEPYMAEEVTFQQAMDRAGKPLHAFMIGQTRETDLALFSDIAGSGPFATPEDVPFSILVPAFVTSELKTAFQIGFLMFLPFLIIDLVVASVLMSMGMMMLSPLIISFPFKIMLFVLVDGWALVMGTLASSFYV